jgi:hypothetical protein
MKTESFGLNPDKPNFETARAQFQEFLGKCEYPQKIFWLMPQDVLVSGKPFVFVRHPVPTVNEAKACKMYEDGMARGRGVLLSTICEMRDSTFCYVWFPKDGEEGHYGLWPKDGNIKMTAKIKSARISGVAIRNPLRWAWLRLRYRSKQGAKDELFS